MATLPRTEHAVARSLAETADPRDAVARALAAIGESLGWPWGAAWEPAPNRPEVLVCTQTWTAPSVDAADFDAVSRGTALAGGEGLPGRVWTSGEPAWIADVSADANFPRARAAGRAGLQTAFCFPIRSAHGTLGVIEFFSEHPLDLDSDLMTTMATLGVQIGQVVERRRDGEQLQANEARHRAMLEAALDCVISMDHEGRVIDFNPAAERTFGYSAADAVGREMAELIIPPSLRDHHREGLARYLGTGHGSFLDARFETVGMRADRSQFPVELTITRIDVPGPPTFTGYLRDITDRKAAEVELKASRVRIVEAADAARRRIERDLHDGAQQRLVELALDLRMARGRLDGDVTEARRLIDEAMADLQAATDELRELARGIHPAVLTEGGLGAGLEALVARSTLPARLVAVPTARLPASVEASAYFVIAEGLTNAARYGEASRVDVEVTLTDGLLRVEVRDDGCGGADPAQGSGLRGLADRVAALDGRLEVESPEGAGTRLIVELPCGS